MQINDLINALSKRRFQVVIREGSKLLSQNPDDTDVLLVCAQAYLELNQFRKGVQCLQHLLRIDAGHDRAWLLLGRTYRESGETEQALSAYRRVPSNSRFTIRSQLQIADIYILKKDFHRAIGLLQKLCRQYPEASQPLHALAAMKASGMELEEAISYAERAFAVDSSSVRSLYLAADCARLLGKSEQCRQFVREILSVEPDSPVARLLDAANSIPQIYGSVAEIDNARANYRQCLDRLERSLPTQLPSKALCDPFSQSMYNLPYQGRNDRDLQKQYGDMAVGLHHQVYPQWSRPLPMSPVTGRIRVGFLSAFFNLHSNWRMPIKGWISQLNPSEFEIFGYSVSAKRDAATEQAESLIEHYVVELGGIERTAERIVADRLHVLIVPEIGMSAEVSKLAMLRLAPVQCSSWGHPNTSGLSTVDYFLSSDLMEPPNGQDAYTEKLVRLPNCSVYLDSDPAPADDLPRAAFGLRESAVIYLCIQFLSKYLPSYDSLLVRIASEVPDSQFVFLQGSKPSVHERLSKRIKQVFVNSGLDYNHHIHWLPHLPGDKFRALQRVADVFLDTTEWSGCNTAVEALQNHVPIVTLPGRWMRGRHCYAFLRQIGVEETIAASEDEYIELAVRLGCDAEFRRHVGARISKNKHLLFGDKKAVTGLERFLHDVTRRQ